MSRWIDKRIAGAEPEVTLNLYVISLAQPAPAPMQHRVAWDLTQRLASFHRCYDRDFVQAVVAKEFPYLHRLASPQALWVHRTIQSVEAPHPLCGKSLSIPAK